MYFESDDLDTGQKVELVLLFTEGYPLEGPLIYLPNLRNTSDVRSDGKVTSLPKNWASSPILMELIEELFEYIAQLLEQSDKIPTLSSICRPDIFNSTTPTSEVMDESTIKVSTHHSEELLQLIDTEHQQFSSPRVDVSTHNNDVQSHSSAFIGTSERRTGFEEVVPKDGTDQNGHLYSDCRTHDFDRTKPNKNPDTDSPSSAECSQLQTDKFYAPSTSGNGNKIARTAQNSLELDSEDDLKLSPARPSNFEVVKFFKQRIEDEISCLNSDYLVLLEETENAVDEITNIEHEIDKCKHEVNNIHKTFSKSMNIKSLANLPIDEQVRTSEKVRLKAEVNAINDTLSIMILALGRNTIHLKDFLEISRRLGREKFLLKYTARTLKLKLKGGRG